MPLTPPEGYDNKNYCSHRDLNNSNHVGVGCHAKYYTMSEILFSTVQNAMVTNFLT